MTMRRKTSQIKPKYDINFYQFSKIKRSKYKFEGNSFFKFLKNAKKCNFYFSKTYFFELYLLYTDLN